MAAAMTADAKRENLGYWCTGAGRADRCAVIDLSGAEPVPVSYGTLEARLDRVAAMLTAAGLGPGDRLALAMGNRVAFIEIMFGAIRAGVVPVPLNTRLDAETLAFIVGDADCVAAAVDPACHPAIVRLVEDAGVARRIALAPAPPGWRDYESALAAAPAGFTPPRLAPDHPAFQPYTSGSTGRPKGVVLTHAGQLWWVRAVQRYWPAAPDERALVAVPLCHKNAMAGAVKPMLHAGASIVLMPRFEPVAFLEALARYRCTQAGAVPTVYALLLQERARIAGLDLSGLRRLKMGSAPV